MVKNIDFKVKLPGIKFQFCHLQNNYLDLFEALFPHL